MKKFCCEDMDYHVNFKCDIHEDPFECPGKIIVFDTKDNDYGLIIHDGGSSSIGIDFCPWCGSKLKFVIQLTGNISTIRNTVEVLILLY